LLNKRWHLPPSFLSNEPGTQDKYPAEFAPLSIAGIQSSQNSETRDEFLFGTYLSYIKRKEKDFFSFFQNKKNTHNILTSLNTGTREEFLFGT
jgi:hypothetical protein